MHIMKENHSVTLYWKERRGAPFISVFPRLHNGWQQKPWYPRWWHGALYWEPKILVGRIYTDRSKWINLGHYWWPYYLTREYHKYKHETYGAVIKTI